MEKKNVHKFELIIGDGGREMQNAFLPIRWCVNKQTIDHIQEQGVVINPHVLIVVAGNGRYGRSETRYLAPLSDMMTYVSFHCPGVNKVHGVIVAAPCLVAKASEKLLREVFLEKTAGNYDTDLLSLNTEVGKRELREFPICARRNSRRNSFTTKIVSVGSTEQEVDIPRELFAVPPKWEEKWVNRWFRRPPVDECEYRRRRVVAYTVQPIVYPVAAAGWLGVVVVASIMRFGYATLLLLSGVRPNWGGAYFHPTKLNEEIRIPGNGMLTCPKSRFGRLYFLLPLTPSYIIVATAVTSLYAALNMATSEVDWVWVAAFVGQHAVGVPILSFLSIFGLLKVFHWLDRVSFRGSFTWYRNWKSSRQDTQWRTQCRNQDASEERARQELELLLCREGPVAVPDLRADIYALPEEKRTIRLRFYAVKAKICRPFA